MRRRLSWAVLGTSGVLAVVMATMISTGEPERSASPKIIVPMADDVVIDVPPPDTTRPSTVFIDVPPVAVTSETVIPAPPEAPAAIAAPKKATPTAKPVVPVPPVRVPAVVPAPQAQQSIWDLYAVYLNYYSSGNSRGDYYDGRDWDDGRRDGRRGR